MPGSRWARCAAALECGGRLDVLAGQVASVTWHPICYEYPPEQIREIGAAKRAAKFRAVRRLIRLVKPELVIPFAVPMYFLDPEIQQHNRWLKPPGLFPTRNRPPDRVRPAPGGHGCRLPAEPGNYPDDRMAD